MMDHVYVKFGDPSRIGFWDIVWKKTNKRTDRQTNTWTPLNTLATAVCAGNPANFSQHAIHTTYVFLLTW